MWLGDTPATLLVEDLLAESDRSKRITGDVRGATRYSIRSAVHIETPRPDRQSCEPKSGAAVVGPGQARGVTRGIRVGNSQKEGGEFGKGKLRVPVLPWPEVRQRLR
jgi:hypothetical protein